ncbi:MAG: DUF1028 domain-containing protein [Hyphomicrobiaceae bacterium]
MTWSIVVHEPSTGAFAVAVATRSFAVGASCPFVRAGVGAVSTQSMTNRYLGPAVLDALARGLVPAAAIEVALAKDGGRDLRQLNVVDAEGRAAQWTGSKCVEWCGGRSSPHLSVAGNMLVGSLVVDATYDAFLANASLALPERLLAALDAGEAAGGDRRGRQSASMLITTTEDFPDLDLRVDDHAAPLEELRRLVELWNPYWQSRQAWLPTKANPSGSADIDAIEEAWQAQGLAIRFRR